ncbi:MAG TPA: VOC family protein [Steroidobacteraceae bacterium]|nr:VOC family protein [Steroidobacteraceae bacterium]
MQQITPCLWFDTQAEEAAKYYVSIFKDGTLGRIQRYGETGQDITGGKPGSVLTVEFTLNGQHFTGLNGGPLFKFSEAISLQIYCKDQEEFDYYWAKLGAGGDAKAQQCGWVKDKFGLSWQVVPTVLIDFLQDPDKQKSERTMGAMLKMKKLDIAELKRAHDGK